MLKLLVISLLVSISFQRAYYNGWNQWKHNCEMCKKFLEIAIKDIGLLKNNTESVGKEVDKLKPKISPKCVSEPDLCNTMLSIEFFMKKVLTLVNVNNMKDSYEICVHDDINFCPPNGRRSMYDTPEFPQLAIDKQSSRNFTLVLESMDKFEL